MITLLHGSFEWIMAGIVVVTGLIIFGIHLVRGSVLKVVIGALVWWFVYNMHSGSTAGVMTATFAALLFDMFGLAIISMFVKK